jgi:hypothetical protein
MTQQTLYGLTAAIGAAQKFLQLLSSLLRQSAAILHDLGSFKVRSPELSLRPLISMQNVKFRARGEAQRQRQRLAGIL